MNEEHKIKANLLNENTGAIRANIISNNNTGEQATTTRKGVLRIATEEEAIEGESNLTAITPYTLALRAGTFVYEQGVASDVWTINHNMNKFPSVNVVDSAGNNFIPAHEYIDENNIVLYMNGSFKGKAYLN